MAGKGPWVVMVNVPGQEPEHVITSPHHTVAMKIAMEVAEKHKRIQGTRITVSDQDSANQPEPGIPSKGGILLDAKPVLLNKKG